MGKTLSIVIGAVVAFIGLVLLISWWYEFLFISRGVIPAILIFGGVIALIAGISEFKDTLKTKKE
ncbi:MAG: hypothetical protein ISS92_04740 [Candidatus Omnitrophica bacterium]|nr:hypothetical protein [Candidatus Omnitrophota bacterium]